MSKNTNLSKKVFRYFNEICAIPHGSENMEKISQYCIDFADKHSLKAVKDKANNVIIYKPAAKGYENADAVILQGHLDMVCQKTPDCDIDFLKDGLSVYTDGDYLKARGTTLGADNGIAVAMILAILEDNTLSHPAIEAILTTDEEIGMIGASQLDFAAIKAKKMINLDSEDEDTVTVSCAGGSDFRAIIPITKEKFTGTKVTVNLCGLKGGHSGVEINKGRVNADILAGRFLNHIKTLSDFRIISIDGGDKGNAIPNSCKIELVCENADKFTSLAEKYIEVLKKEIASRENNFTAEITLSEKGEYSAFQSDFNDKFIGILTSAPNGVKEMSAEIEGLVETSLNLGILKTEEKNVIMHFALRSNKRSALSGLEEKLSAFFSLIDCTIKTYGHYPPWEFKEDSVLRQLYVKTYKEQFGTEPKVEAIHAGLECGLFSSNIKNLDCIAIGPQLYDVHTVNERLSISSTERIFNLLLKILEKIQ